jgi:hypothetical protein
MISMKIDQALEAKRFIAENSVAVEFCFEMLKKYATQFMSSYGTKFISLEDIKVMQIMLKNKDLSGFSCVLRRNAAYPDGSDVRAKYWSIIDSINAFIDACGSYWPYMTPSGRLHRLQHAHLHLTEYDIS